MVRFHVTPVEAPTAQRAGSSRPVAASDFSVKFAALFEAVGLSQREYAEVLEVRLNRPVSQVVLSGWLRGRSPRSRGAQHNPAKEVLQAAQDILQDQGSAPVRIGSEEVQRTIQAWLDKGLTMAQIQVSAEVADSLLRDWYAGRAAVLRSRWEGFCLRVNTFADLVAESQLAWKVEAQIHQRIARAKKLVGKHGIASLEEAYERLRAAELIAEASISESAEVR